MYDLKTLTSENVSVDLFKDTQIDEYYADITAKGKQISAEALAENPYPGLRPFKTSENIVFLGREEISTDLIKRLATNRFLAVLGASGTGKSSLVRAGLLPALSILPGRHGLWKIAIFRPGKNPFGNFVEALSRANVFPNYNKNKLWETLSTSSFGFEKLYKSEPVHETYNTLIIVDQFEELFRYRKDKGVAGRNEAALFVKMLIDITNNEKLNAYVMITMRSEFLGDCVQLTGLPEAINNGQYLVPRLRQDQLIDAIVEPALFAGAAIEGGFAEKLVGEIGDDMDQLPVLQHALRRTYQAAKDEAEKMNGAISEVNLSYKHYCAIGKMESAIDQHANEIYNALSKKEQEYCKVIFQSITDIATDGRGIRRPLPLSTIVKICGETIDCENKNLIRKNVVKVIDAFRKDKVNFLLPALLDQELAQTLNTNDELSDNIEIDISHESIMRVWKRLGKWMEEEAKHADLLKHLITRDPTDYLKGGILTVYERWLTLKENAFTWINLYKPSYIEEKDYPDKFKAAIRLIKDSLQKQKDEETEKERKIIEEQGKKEEKLKSKRNKLIARISIAAAVLSLSLLIVAMTQTKKANKALLQKTELKRKLDSTNIQADAQRKIDLAKAQADAQRKIDLAKAQAEAQRKIDLAKAQADAQRKIDLAKAQADAQRKIDLADAKASKAEAERKALPEARKQILALTKQKFYQSSFLDQDTKDMYVDHLIEIKYGDGNSLQFEKQLNDLNAMIDIKELSMDDPNRAIVKAKQVYDSSKSKLTDSILFSIANNNLFYIQNIPNALPKYVDYYSNRLLSAVSESKTLLAIKLANSIKLFKINSDDSIIFYKEIQINSDSIGLSKNNLYYTKVNSSGSLTFVGEDSLVAFIDNRIYKISIQNNSVIAVDSSKIKIDEIYYTSALSPDGKKLAIDYDNYNIKLWDITENNTEPIIIKPDQADGLVDSIIFSYNSKKILVKQDYKHRIFNLPNYTDKKIVYPKANFTQDNKYLIAQSTPGVYNLYDSMDSLIDNLKIDTFINAAVNSFVLSSDWKKLFIRVNSYDDYLYFNKIYLFQKSNNDSIFSFNHSKKYSGGILKELPYLSASDILFSIYGNLISINSDYSNFYIKKWKDFNKINDTNQVNALIKSLPYEVIVEKNLPDILANLDTITSEAQLETAASLALQKDARFLQKNTLNDARKIYERLTEINAQKNITEFRSLSRNYFTYYVDTLQRINDLKKTIALKDNMPQSKLSDSLTSSDCWNLSWYLIFAKEYDSAVYYAAKGIDMFQKNNGIYTNVALGYLLSGQCEKANNVYKEYKGQKYLSDNRDFTTSFLQDLSDLETAGIITPDDKDIYDRVQKVRQFLNDETTTLDCSNN